MKVAIHQPNFIPWLGYFYKMANADVFVILDDAQYEKNGFLNRVKIKTPQGGKWLTIPTQSHFPQAINVAELADYPNERLKCLKTIYFNYKKAPYFDYFFPELEQIINGDWRLLSDLNIALIHLVKKKLGIKTRLEIASSRSVNGESTERLLNLCVLLQADTYLSGRGGKNYQDEFQFKSVGIKLEYSDFNHPVYPQQWGVFAEGLSIIDLLFNCGPESGVFFRRK